MTRTTFAFALLALAAPVAAQQSAPATTRAAGPEYHVPEVQRALAGENWRELWVRPLTVPVLDLGMNGGLKPERQGGGNQSITLHFVDATGNGWVFRSVNKFPGRALPRDLKGTVAEDIVKDQVSAMHPGGHFVVPRLLEALDILHVAPTLYVMPNDPRLGEFRETFAGMLGMLELKPNEGPDDTPGFAGATKVKDTDAFLEDLEESPDYRLETREYLRSRLVDFIINDTDRGTDQWRWARFGSKGNYTYRPIPRDRDWALVNGEGFVALAARSFFPKHTFFDDRLPQLDAFTFSSHLLDRRLLAGMSRADFRRELAFVQQRLTNQVLAAAMRDLPAAYHADHVDEMIEALQIRRDNLGRHVERWYEWLASDPDVHATDERDRADIEHLSDGSLRVRLARASGGAPYFDRRFLPGETNEVRIFMHGEADQVVVSGKPGRVIVRVIGGGGDDRLEDRAGQARFYDDRGDNQVVRASGTKFSAEPWTPPAPPEGLRVGRSWVPDYGKDTGLSPLFGYEEGAGVVIGPRYSIVRYGFREAPYDWKLDLAGMYATRSGGFGVQLDLDQRFENSRAGLLAHVRGTQFDAFRFYGYGNDSPDIGSSESLVMQDQLTAFAGVRWALGVRVGKQREEIAAESSQRPFLVDAPRGITGSFFLGPIAQWTRPRPGAGNPLADAFEGERETFGQFGARAALELKHTDRPSAPRRGFAFDAEARGFPLVTGDAESFGSVSALARTYVPLLGDTHLALRLGGEQVLGDAPAFESAFLGGRTSLRGFRFERFAGDAAAFGGAELRIPIDTVKLVLNGELGVYALADAGRVWLDGDSPGGWHTATGAGVWFSTMNRTISLTYARGERNRWYLWAGLPF